jgi:hypothetical protein
MSVNVEHEATAFSEKEKAVLFSQIANLGRRQVGAGTIHLFFLFLFLDFPFIKS